MRVRRTLTRGDRDGEVVDEFDLTTGMPVHDVFNIHRNDTGLIVEIRRSNGDVSRIERIE